MSRPIRSLVSLLLAAAGCYPSPALPPRSPAVCECAVAQAGDATFSVSIACFSLEDDRPLRLHLVSAFGEAEGLEAAVSEVKADVPLTGPEPDRLAEDGTPTAVWTVHPSGGQFSLAYTTAADDDPNRAREGENRCFEGACVLYGHATLMLPERNAGYRLRIVPRDRLLFPPSPDGAVTIVADRPGTLREAAAVIGRPASFDLDGEPLGLRVMLNAGIDLPAIRDRTTGLADVSLALSDRLGPAASAIALPDLLGVLVWPAASVGGTLVNGEFLSMSLTALPEPGAVERLFAHEFLHLYNGRALGHPVRPPYGVDPQTAWFLEGATDYLAVRGLHDTGLFNDGLFDGYVARWTAEYVSSPLRDSHSVAGAWERGDWTGRRLVYARGALAACLLDREIGRGSDGRSDLFDLLRLLVERFPAGSEPAFAADDLRATAVELAGTGIGPFYDGTMDGKDPIDPACCSARLGE